MKSFTFRPWLISALRRISYRYPPRYETLYHARVKRGVYLCAGCRKEYARKDVQLDHVEPVIDPKVGFPVLSDGREDWSTFIPRLLPSHKGWQVLCLGCHSTKTKAENTIRRGVNKKRPKPRKKR